MILHLKNFFKDSDRVLQVSKRVGYKPAPCITNMADLVYNDYRTYFKPNKEFFNADKCFIWEDRQPKEFLAIKRACIEVIQDALYEYSKGENISDLTTWTIDHFSIVKYEVGGYFCSHQDTLWHPSGKVKSLSICVYLSDFGGGELVFQNKEQTAVAVSKGDVVVFPAGENFKHASEFVTSGTKYVMTLWPLVDNVLEICK